MPKETAAARQAREAKEARIAEEKWEAEKPMRLLKALARLDDKAHACVYMHCGGMRYKFTIPDSDIFEGYVDQLSDWTMRYIENTIDDYEAKRQKEAYMLALRAELLSKMTDEEKEALGL